jgi:hypothetical protein
MKKIQLLTLLCLYMIALANRCCFAQARAGQFASSFGSLGRSTIYNELMIVDPIAPKVVVLAGHGTGEEIDVFSLSDNRSRIIWRLSEFPPSVEVIDPRDLQIKYTDAGPVITMHGCARHLCGGRGSAGAFTYFLTGKRMCSALANWDDRASRADFSYSCPGGMPTDQEKGLLDGMLREEGY